MCGVRDWWVLGRVTHLSRALGRTNLPYTHVTGLHGLTTSAQFVTWLQTPVPVA